MALRHKVENAFAHSFASPAQLELAKFAIPNARATCKGEDPLPALFALHLDRFRTDRKAVPEVSLFCPMLTLKHALV